MASPWMHPNGAEVVSPFHESKRGQMENRLARGVAQHLEGAFHHGGFEYSGRTVRKLLESLTISAVWGLSRVSIPFHSELYQRHG